MKKRIAILGAGPIGIEAALRALEDGHQVEVYEQGGVGAHVERWQHVKFFSPWALNRSRRAESLLTDLGMSLASGAVYPSGRQYLDEYLRPLAASRALLSRIRLRTSVVGVARSHAMKGEWIGRPERGAAPFVIQVQQLGQERFVEADVVVDATGVLENPNRLGPGGLAAVGEGLAEPYIDRGIPDILGGAREHYAGRRVLVVGEGYSAATSLQLLSELRRDAPGTQISWVMRSTEAPYRVIADDSLPERASLIQFANAAARGQVEGLSPLNGSTILEFEPTDEGIRVEIDRLGKEQRFMVDRIISNVG
ncbi:MAG: flavoprotein, partial [Bradymonadaceae bacterium]